MKKGYYICYDSSGLGVSKKINLQMSIFEKHFQMVLFRLKSKEQSFFSKIFCRMPLQSALYNYDECLKQLDDPSFIYIRRFGFDNAFIKFLKTIKKKFNKVTLLIELYTYPYDKDEYFSHSRFKLFPFFLKDFFWRGKLKKFVDRFITFSDDDNIFGIKTISCINGLNVSKCFFSNHEYNVSNTINLISVARMQRAHGYERIIYGLFFYYKNGGDRDIIFHVIGDGYEEKKYKKLAKKLSLERRVLFYGRKSGDELNALLSSCDIGIAPLGMYKNGININSALKIPEYLSHGLPIISGCKIKMNDNAKIPFCLEFENNRTPIDIFKVVDFYDSFLVPNSGIVSQLQRDFAKQHFDMDIVMQPIIFYIENNKQ